MDKDMVSIPVDEYQKFQEWKKLKPQLAKLVGEKPNPRSNYEVKIEALEFEKPGVKEVYDFIEQNDSVDTKQKVVDIFEGVYSRNKVFACIQTLIDYGLVNARKNPENHRDIILTINKDSLLNSLIAEFREMESVYLSLLEPMNGMLKEFSTLCMI
jgi:archaellum biogenesis ATPase FlaH